MFKRKLQALGFHDPDTFDITDERKWRNLIVWLEDQKIRLYTIEDRGPLRNTCGGDWPTVFQKYLKDLQYTRDPNARTVVLDWLLGHSIRLEYGENVEKYKSAQPILRGSDGKAKVASDDIFAHLDVNSPEFKAGIISVSQQLSLPLHEDPLVMLKAVDILLQQRLSKEAISKAGTKDEGIQLQLKDIDAGFKIKGLFVLLDDNIPFLSQSVLFVWLDDYIPFLSQSVLFV
ncbi:RNA transcription, translation and transport factor protein-like [Saccoglossus kowalevskii]|uniref:UPF0568 protein C14orf166 homolog n=1 Tax=Saccoglossus kowalevskii TaxID=10224 RepID=A0ABM0GZK2_SACKO|nr:PREDICTED: UPF0568 protein C14orf166 homolog [Saccoglossus kowalevskii]